MIFSTPAQVCSGSIAVAVMLWSPIWARNEQFLRQHFSGTITVTAMSATVFPWVQWAAVTTCLLFTRAPPHIGSEFISHPFLLKSPTWSKYLWSPQLCLGCIEYCEQTYLPRPLITSSLVASNNPDSLQASANLASHSTSHLVINHQSSVNGHLLSRLSTPAGLKLKEQQGRKCASPPQLRVKLLGRQSIRGHSSPTHFH